MDKIRNLSVLLLLFFACLQAQAPDQLLREGDECFARQSTEQAVGYYRAANAKFPRQSATVIRLIRSYSDLGWLHLKKDTSAESYYRLAVAYADTLLQVSPNSASSHFWMALAQGSLIPFQTVSEKIHIAKEVRFQAETAVELDSSFALAYIILAIFERESSQLSWLERTIARIVFGEELNGSLSYSEELLEKALTYDPGNSYAYYELYWTCLAEGKKEAAVQALKTVMALPVRSQREERQFVLAKDYLASLESSLR